MNILDHIADALQAPKGAYDRMLEQGLPTQVIDEILALIRDQSAELEDRDEVDNMCIYTFISHQ